MTIVAKKEVLYLKMTENHELVETLLNSSVSTLPLHNPQPKERESFHLIHNDIQMLFRRHSSKHA